MKKFILAISSYLVLTSVSHGAWRKQGGVTDYPFNTTPAAGDYILLWDAGTNTTQQISILTLDARWQGLNTHLTDLSDGSLTGTKVGLADVGGYFSTDNVEAALQQLGAGGGGDAYLGAPATFSELTASDFLIVTGNADIADITLGTVVTYTDNIRQVFNPGASAAGLNAGAYAGNPSTLLNGDIWYNSATGAIMGRAGGVSVDLGATGGGGGGTTLTPTDLAGGTTLAVNTWYHDTLSLNRTMDDIDLIGVDGDQILWTFDVTGATRSLNFFTNSTVWRVGEVNAITSVVNFPVGNHHLRLHKMDGKWWLTDSGIITESARAFSFAVSDEITALTVGTKLTWRAPFACTIVSVYADLTSSSSSGLPTFDINKNGASILSTPLTVDVSETDSATAVTAAVVSNPSLAARDRLTFDIDVPGTGATGAKITIVYTQP